MAIIAVLAAGWWGGGGERWRSQFNDSILCIVDKYGTGLQYSGVHSSRTCKKGRCSTGSWLSVHHHISRDATLYRQAWSALLVRVSIHRRLAHWKKLICNWWFFCKLIKKQYFYLSTKVIHKELRCFADFFKKIVSVRKRMILFRSQIEPTLLTFYTIRFDFFYIKIYFSLSMTRTLSYLFFYRFWIVYHVNCFFVCFWFTLHKSTKTFQLFFNIHIKSLILFNIGDWWDLH